MQSKAKSGWLLATLLTIGFVGNSLADTTLIDRVVAVVNDQVILLSEVDKHSQAVLDKLSNTLPPEELEKKKKEIRKKTIELLINETLVDQKVIEHKIEINEVDLKRKVAEIIKLNKMNEQQFSEALKVEGKTLQSLYDQIRSQMKKEKLMGTQMQMNPEIKSKMQVSESDIQNHYNEHYSKIEKIRASHILFLVSANATAEKEKDTHERAQKVLDVIRAGASFEESAKQFSEDPSSSTGGDLGWFGKGDMVATFEKAAFSMKKGQVSDLVRTRFGFHIIKVVDRVKEVAPTLESVRGQIYQQLFSGQYYKAVQAWLDQLRSEAYVEVKL